MRQVTNKYQLAWNGLKMKVKARIREMDDAENVAGPLDDYLEIERDTLEGILQEMEVEEGEIKGCDVE